MDGRAAYKAMVARSVARLKARRKTPGATLHDRTLMIEVNRGCRAGCATCYRLDAPRQAMERALFERLMVFADSHLFMAYLLGGEPTECLDMIVDAAAAKPGLLVALITFGESLTPANVGLLASAPNIVPIISVDGIGEVNDRSRRPGAYARVARAIDELNRQGLAFGIGTVASRLNLHQILSGELAAWVDGTGAAIWDIIRYYPIGENQATHESLTLDAPMQEELSVYRQQLFADNPYGFEFFSADNPERRCPRKLKILMDGKVSYCPFSAWELGAIAAADDDRTIFARLEDKHAAWNAMTAAADGYCPLNDATEAFISFHEAQGRPFQPATGMLDRDSPVHRRYRRE